jgi:DNA-binding transcriptional ArsR family regulator
MKPQDAGADRTQSMLACLAVPSRFRLVRAIAEADRCVGELAISVGLSQSCTTRHLQALERAGLIEGRRDGKRVRFAISAESGETERVLGLVVGISRPRTAQTASVPAPVSRRVRPAKSLPKGAMGETSSSREASTGRGLDLPPPSDEDARDEPNEGVRPFRRQDIEDYLL